MPRSGACPIFRMARDVRSGSARRRASVSGRADPPPQRPLSYRVYHPVRVYLFRIYLASIRNFPSENSISKAAFVPALTFVVTTPPSSPRMTA